MPNERGLYVHDTASATWRPTGNPGIRQKAVRADGARGQFLGLVALDGMTRTGMHRHLGVGGGMVLSGQVTDYFVDQGPGDYAVNHANTAHDAFAFCDTVMVVRLEAPQVFFEAEDVLQYDNGNRAATEAERSTPRPEQPPEILIRVPDVVARPTAIGGVSRKTVFDYAHMESDHRIAMMYLLPRSEIPAFRTADLLEWMVLGGVLEANGAPMTTMQFMVVEPGTEVRLRSTLGAKLMAWSHAPIAWADGVIRDDLFGF